MLTAGDCITRAINFVGGEQGDRSLFQARTALNDAVRDFTGYHRWNYYKTIGRVYLEASYATGTVAYSAGLNQVTLTGGVWPAWAADGQILIGAVVAQAKTRVSDTVLTLDSAVHFSDDILAGTGYNLFLDSYTLPLDLTQIDSPMPEQWWGSLRYVPPSGYLWGLRSGIFTTGIPVRFTILPDRNHGGRLAMKVYPYPDRTITLDFVYARRMMPIIYDVGAGTGVVTATVGSTAVAGSGVDTAGFATAFMPDMVGRVFRLGRDIRSPEANGIRAFESTVLQVVDSSHLLMADTCPVDLTNVGYSVSDQIDVDPVAMATAFQWLVIQSIAADNAHKGLPTATSQFNLWLIKAREADSRYVGKDVAGPQGIGRPFRFRGPIGVE